MFHLRILLPAEHNLHPSPPVTPSYNPFLREPALPFHARYVPHLECKAGLYFLHRPPGDGAGEYSLVSKGLGTE